MAWLGSNSGRYPNQFNAAAEEKRLARWIHNQREAYQRQSVLHVAQIQALEELPGWSWNIGANHCAYFYAPPQYDAEVVCDHSRLHECFTETGNNILRVVHYQWHGYEHYEVVWCNAMARGFDTDVATRIKSAITDTQLARALSEDNRSTYRTLVMALLGIDKQTSDDESSASSGSSSSDCSSSSEDDQRQDISNGVRKTLATN